MASTAGFAVRSVPPPGHRPGPSERRSTRLVRWLAALGFGTAALALTLLLRAYLSGTVFVFFFFAITLTAWYSGLWPALVLSMLALIATDVLLIGPPGQLTLDGRALVPLTALGATAVLISWVTDSLGRARAQLERTNAELAEVAARAEEANRAKSEFLTVMSHELRTPLNAILGYVDLLGVEAGGPLTAAQKTQLSRIRSSSYRLLDLIQDILSLSRIETGQESLELVEVDVGHIVHDAVIHAAQQSLSSAVEQSVELPIERLLMFTDAAKLQQILTDLLGNARKFTDAGRIELRVARAGDDVIFRVTDTGPGIAPEHLELIFEPFRQIDQSMTRPKDGAGIGLPVSRRLAHMLGGELSIDSVVGQGSTFTLRLPVSAAAANGGA